MATSAKKNKVAASNLQGRTAATYRCRQWSQALMTDERYTEAILACTVLSFTIISELRTHCKDIAQRQQRPQANAA
jgi:hypothetical protein